MKRVNGLPPDREMHFLSGNGGEHYYFHTILEETPNGVFVVSSDHRIIHANPAVGRFLGIDEEQLCGVDLEKILGEDGKDLFTKIRAAENGTAGGETVKIQHEMELLHQAQRLILRVVVVFPPGRSSYFLIYLIDITPQKHLEGELRRHNAFFHNLLNSSVDGIIASDMEGRIVLYNKGAQELLGYTEEETRELHVTQLYNEGVAHQLIKQMRSDDYGGRGKLLRHELIVCDKNGQDIPVSFSGGIVYDHDQEMATFGIFTDLRAMQQIEEDLEQTHRRLMQSEKMAGLGRLAAGVAHEINNPMSGIMLYANFVKEELPEEDPLLADLDTIIHEAERCKVIVADLLAFSHQNTYEMEPISLNEVIGKTLTILRHQPVFEAIEIVQDLDAHLPKIMGNAIRLNQVVMNIVVNAAQAMEGKGRLKITSRLRAGGDIMELLISDTGPGIPEEMQEKIFDPFFTTKATGKGTGLGLSVSYAIVKEHRGTIRVRSSAESGTTFSLKFPIALEESNGEDHE